jgi:organic radical activating enzyme
MELSLPFLDELFSSFEKQTKGLLMTGGEPTSSPNFGKALKLARARGFEEIAVVTNGSLLDQPRVLDALLEHVRRSAFQCMIGGRRLRRNHAGT